MELLCGDADSGFEEEGEGGVDAMSAARCMMCDVWLFASLLWLAGWLFMLSFLCLCLEKSVGFVDFPRIASSLVIAAVTPASSQLLLHDPKLLKY